MWLAPYFVSWQVQHHPRTLSKSKYGLSRIFRFILDLTTLCFWQQFRDKPMHLMGLLGGLCIIGSLFTGAFAGWSLVKATQAWGFKVAISNATPCLVLTAELLIMGLQVRPQKSRTLFWHVYALSELGWSCVSCRCWRCMLAQASSQ